MPNLKTIKKKLETRLDELTQRMEKIDDQLSNAGDDDFEEMATEAADDETLEGVGHATQEEVDQIHRALTRVENGTYGKCTACGCAIAPERLDAVPYASRCISCAR